MRDMTPMRKAASRPVCVHCGAKYGSRITHSETVRWPEGEPMPRYTGNGAVTKTGTPSRMTLKADVLAERAKRKASMNAFALARVEPELDSRFYADEPTMYARREVWDGESWSTPYEPFCTLRCALSYARQAYRKR